MSARLVLHLDDGDDGDVTWTETTVAGGVPRVGDEVFHDGRRWRVERVAWDFVQPGSRDASENDLSPFVRLVVAPQMSEGER